MTQARDHGGGLDAAIARYGGVRADWIDLSTGINPVPYPVGKIDPQAWTALPDSGAMARLLDAARSFWNVPDGADIVAANGASAIIARLPFLGPGQGEVHIPTPTYNEHAAAFDATRQWFTASPDTRDTHVYVHPNNPDGRTYPADVIGGRRLTVIDESFCDVMPEASHIALVEDQGIMVLKSFGKFWGLGGVRLGFAIGAPETLSPVTRYADDLVEVDATLQDHLGPWSVSGPALEIGARALADQAWAEDTRARLVRDADRLDALLTGAGAQIVGGTSLFRLYEVDDAARWQEHLARHHIWSRVFPYSKTWLRLGLPHPDAWAQLADAIAGV
ncbi:threonine-phosphate decarboxylase [Octadecabacter sp. R77987]|uniref:threonine-phosphate decarboxylase n=1 Tax=Octadecabacter sp. R77987 TaxID=3093874 RepID=UPI00366BF3CC